MEVKRVEPGPGQESVWDYPRPPRAEPSSRHIQVLFNGTVIADTQRAWRVLEISHPPSYYIPLEDIQPGVLRPTPHTTFCEWKGRANYYTVVVGNKEAVNAAWYYPEPTADFEAIANYVALYPHLMESCLVDGEPVSRQAGSFYGGWITSDIVGPFKGEPGTLGW
ncbi:MAG: DUF427 domain-containing protein [Ardenticatenales bacterium]|nr:DUF427 domain-containing protein [Ardenticatenales bacterium]